MFNFADIDRDGMIDMFYVGMQADSTGVNMVVHYNALKNADADRDRAKVAGVEDALHVIGNVCSPTNLPVEELMDIYMAPSEISKTLNDKGIPNSDRVVKTNLFPRESGISALKSVDRKHMPGRVSIGDISADGFPDIIVTMHYDNGTDRAHILLNSPCHQNVCGQDAKKSRRRMFTSSS